jgi:hypothetical protein
MYVYVCISYHTREIREHGGGTDISYLQNSVNPKP